MKIQNILSSLLTLLFTALMTAVTFAENIEIYKNDHKNQLIIRSDIAFGTNTTLFFGENLTHSLEWDSIKNAFVFSDNVDFNHNEIQNVRLENLATAPICDSTFTGKIYHNTTDTHSYICNAVDWEQIDEEPGASGLLQPYFYSISPIYVNPNNTVDLIIAGGNFDEDTIFTVGNGVTVNSVTINSDKQATINITADATETIGIPVNATNDTLNDFGTNLTFDVKILDGSNQVNAGTSCKTLLDNGMTTSGNYWINPNEGSTDDAFEVYCDMTTEGGGWIKIPYAQDLAHINRWTSGDSRRWLNDNLTFALTDAQINNIRSISTEGKQTYVGTCDGVIHYEYNSSYTYGFGFRYHTGFETAFGVQTYPNTTISVPSDGCKTNSSTSADTIFELRDVRLPILNLNSRDNGNSGEAFGSPLLSNPAWLR